MPSVGIWKSNQRWNHSFKMIKVRLITNDTEDEISDWCNEQFGITGWGRQGVAIDPVKFLPVVDYHFWDEEHATLFALRWKR